MKKIFLLIAASFVFFSAFSVSIKPTQEDVDKIVLQHMSQETRNYVIYAKEGVQQKMTITTVAEEDFELNYSCWVYYIIYPDKNLVSDRYRYLIVNENNGNLLEIKPKSESVPSDLTEWREVSFFCERAQLWDYPVKPGTEEWEALQTGQAMVDVCQIPENILSCLSTENLLKVCLQYPLRLDIYAANCLDDGINSLFKRFNGVEELLERTDGVKELLKYYDNTMMQNLSKSDMGDPAFTYRVAYIELLLSQCHSQKDCIEILQYLTAGYEKGIGYIDAGFYNSWLASNVYARAKMIVEISPQSAGQIPYYTYLLCGHIIDKETIDVINELSYQLIE